MWNATGLANIGSAEAGAYTVTVSGPGGPPATTFGSINLNSNVAATPLAVVRRSAAAGQLSRVVPEACGTVWTALKAAGARGGRHVAVYLDCSDGQVDAEIGAEVDDAFAGRGDVVRSATPAGEVATTTHFGPYARLGDAHRAIVDWCAAHGRARAGPNWEVYGHWLSEWDADPSKIRTDVFYLLKT